MTGRPTPRHHAPMPPSDARRIATVIVSAVRDAPASGADVTDQLTTAARQAAPELIDDPALTAAAELYKVVVDPRPSRGWTVIDSAVLEEMLVRAFVQDPRDALWRDYEAHLAAIENARPRMHPLLDLLLRRTPSISPEGLQGIRQSRAALRAHRRSTD